MLNLRGSFRPLPDTTALKKLGNASAASYGSTLKLVSWNMFKARRRGCLPDLTTLASGAELVLLQEAVLHGGLANPFHLTTGLEWIMAENLGTSQSVTTGPKTGSRVAAVTSQAVRSLDREPFIGTPKTFLLTTYPFGNGVLLVINVHAVNLVSTAKFARQVEQMVAPVAAHDGPCIVAGDFNTWNEARWHLLLKAMADVGLHRVPAAAPQWRHFNQVLDHVFYRGMKLLSARPLMHVKSSDHVPLWAEFAPGDV
jgi:endonuclease/exonuclease/phosphatase (EEP) superfamily protein YafD